MYRCNRLQNSIMCVYTKIYIYVCAFNIVNWKPLSTISEVLSTNC